MTTALQPSLHSKIRIFNPHRLKPKELEESFIARQELFQSILADLAAGRPTSAPQHHLVIGQRGMGKTTLLRRLALELHRPPYNESLLALSFAEEQYVEVDRLSKFWLNCLDAAADALEFEGQTAAVAQIDAEVQRLAALKLDETTYHEACRDAFTKIWKPLGRRPVLFIDNFNLLLARLRTDDFSLRGYFSAPGAPVLVAASTVYPQELEDYGAAFYDGFKPYYLHPLTLQEVRDVFIRLAQVIEKPELVDRVYHDMPRLAALRDLTGGNPRTTVLLFELFVDGFSEDAVEDLDALLDVVTPLYQSRLDQLSELSQTIVGTLARNWSPMSKAEIVAQARLVDSSVPAQLGRLREIGLVEETPLFPSKKTGYQIAERLFNVWYLIRFSSRRQHAGLDFLPPFLQQLQIVPDEEAACREEIRRDPNAAAPWNNLGVLLRDQPGRYAAEESAYREAIRLDPKLAVPWNNLGVLLQNHFLNFTEAEDAYREAIRLDPNYASPWNNLGILLTYRFGRYAEAEDAYRESIRLDPADPWPWNRLGYLLQNYLGRFEEAELAYLEAIRRDPENDAPRHNLAFLYRDQMQKIAEAKAVLRDLNHRDRGRDTQLLHTGLFVAYDRDWLHVASALKSALLLIGGQLPVETRDHWFRASAVLLHLGYGSQFVTLLQEARADIQLLPWFAAVQAHALGDKRHLVNLPAEAWPAAEQIFDEIDRRRRQLPPVLTPA